MECLSCSLDRSYNRAVVEAETDSEIAHLCFKCEAKLEKLLGQHSEDAIGDCLVCGKDGQYLLPKLAPVVEPENLDSGPQFEYAVSPETPWFCEKHLMILKTQSIDRNSARL